MWNNRQGLPSRSWRRSLASEHVRTRERAQQFVQRVADGVGVGVGPEVAGALAASTPHDLGPRPLVREGDTPGTGSSCRPACRTLNRGRCCLISCTPTAAPRPRCGPGSTRRRRGRNHLGSAGRQVAGVLEVVGQALAQRLGLADVDDPTLGVLELVAARGVGDRPGRRSFEHRCRTYRRRRRHSPHRGGRTPSDRRELRRELRRQHRREQERATCCSPDRRAGYARRCRPGIGDNSS